MNLPFIVNDSPRLICPLLKLLAALLPATAMAIPSTDRLFSSELEAVKAAADFYNPISIEQDREFMGTIYRSGKYFGYTVNAGQIGANQVSIEIPVEQWDSVVALWHTHGDASPLHRYFSRPDTRLVKRLGKPLYLADYTGTLKIFRPSDRPLSGFAAQRYGLPPQRGFAVGEPVFNSQEVVTVATGRQGAEPAYC